MTNSKGKKIVERLKNFTESLERGDDIPEKFTCRTIKLNIEPATYNADSVKKTRQLLGASQAIFAQFLGVSVKTVHDWEQNRKNPQDVACRLMDEICRDPAYWLNRLHELSTPVDSRQSG